MMQIPRIFSGIRMWLLTRLVMNGFFQAIATLANAFLVELAFDKIITAANFSSYQQIWQIGLGLLAAAVVTALLRMMERTDAERIGQEYVYELRLILYDRLMSLSPRTLQNRSQGGVMLRFVSDLSAIRQWVSLGLARLVVAITVAIASLLALSLVNIRLAVTVALVLTIGTISAFRLSRKMRTTAKEARDRLSRLAGNINEKVGSIAVVQVFGQSQREKRRIARQCRELEEAMVNRAVVAGQMQAITEGTTAIAASATLLMGALEVTANRATPGTVVAAMTIVGFLVPRLRDLGKVQEYWHNSRVAIAKIQQFLATPSLVKEIPNAPELQTGPGCLEFDDVSLEGGLHNISAIAFPGEIVAIVGPNGAGKSTLLSLAARLVDPDQGVIRLDGQDLTQHSLKSVRRAIGMAALDLPLLRGSVDKNLRYRWRDAPIEEITRVRQLCGIDELLAELPEGEKTRVAEGGKGLSAGQRQRIALARAILGNPPVLLLDEVDANLDAQAAAVVDRILAEYQGTVLIITHRKERLAAADAVWHLEAGRLIEAGPTKELLAKDGPTSRLFWSHTQSVMSQRG
ncbi:ABC transporter ATP-binding protein [Calothrix sp. FACHB-1219]|uniref:ABC transporter ATP-binding protein n=1 Tax=unclassified Calothrix TaxID=2619626 RepID=UPI001686C80C|nr:MULTISPECIES: ABC transporter ATP-binding protein [unclassified Calothrix]MBD2204964.1 ABC transporter ATP-binding protein [Calothrix sp. FACHB-168]MBD2216212.1 ABC transporter ATP-binding protein [Calothrix sp. FACHB-1219]